MAVLPHPEPLSLASYSAVELSLDNQSVILLDQRRLPAVEEYYRLEDYQAVVRAIADMVVRGAPAIGITGAYALVLAARGAREAAELEVAARRIAAARPTAVNLKWAVDRSLGFILAGSASAWVERAAEVARRIHREDVEACRTLGRLGAESIADGARILTHCNAGALATGGYGTALGVIRAARDAGKTVSVLADETRPYLQGARLTAWELSRDGIPVEVIADSSAAWLMSRGRIDVAVVGSDRIAGNGDVANKIGTYSVALAAHHHRLPFYVAAPWSTVDLDTPSGGEIPIEERSGQEISHFLGQPLTPSGVGIENPAFDVTPAALVTALFTERGVVRPLGSETLERLSGPIRFNEGLR